MAEKARIQYWSIRVSPFQISNFANYDSGFTSKRFFLSSPFILSASKTKDVSVGVTAKKLVARAPKTYREQRIHCDLSCGHFQVLISGGFCRHRASRFFRDPRPSTATRAFASGAESSYLKNIVIFSFHFFL